MYVDDYYLFCHFYRAKSVQLKLQVRRNRNRNRNGNRSKIRNTTTRIREVSTSKG